jgi:hypothetical protein
MGLSVANNFFSPYTFFSTFMCNTHNPVLSLHYETHTRVPDAKTKLTAAQIDQLSRRTV